MSISDRPAKGNITRPPERDDLLQAALDYRRRGWSIIPTRGKRAAVRWRRYQEVRAATRTLRDWFGSGRRDGVDGLAVVLGGASAGLACRDYDTVAAYHQWAGCHRELAEALPTVRTLRGYHVYTRTSEEAYVDLGDGEWRADRRHYCLVPPARHPEGCHYYWEVPPPDGPLPLIDPRESGLCPDLIPLRRPWPPPVRPPGEPALADKQLLCVTIHTPGWLNQAIQQAIRATLPTGPGQRNHRVLDLVRHLKWLNGLDTSPESLRRIVAEWHRQALPVIRTKPFDETWTDFEIAWPRARVPVRSADTDEPGILDAIAEARATPTPAAGLVYEAADLRFLVTLCACLQRAHGDGPFFLSVRTAAYALGTYAMDASRKLRRLVAAGILTLVRQGSYQRRGRLPASEYRYVARDT